MIVGMGIDICSIERIERSLQRWGERFERRILCDRERAAIAKRVDRATALAGRFAAKEATIKALAGAPGVSWHHMEIGGRPRTPPQLLLHGPAKELADELGVSRAHLSITHDGGVAAAVVVLERD